MLKLTVEFSLDIHRKVGLIKGVIGGDGCGCSQSPTRHSCLCWSTRSMLNASPDVNPKILTTKRHQKANLRWQLAERTTYRAGKLFLAATLHRENSRLGEIMWMSFPASFFFLLP